MGARGAETAFIADWLEDTLKAAPDLAALVAARVHEDMATASLNGTPIVFPLVVFKARPATHANGPGGVRMVTTQEVAVVGVARVTTWAPLAPVAKAIDTALVTPQGETGYSDAEGNVLTCVNIAPFQQIAEVDGEQMRHLGAVYRIQVTGAS